ncbi:MAG: T9SS type A sorting domain-containing protein [Saprospiraceae bacterium]|nr:T9SS type A sorting domain-containing protein [Saprospiraceae bacterium]
MRLILQYTPYFHNLSGFFFCLLILIFESKAQNPEAKPAYPLSIQEQFVSIPSPPLLRVPLHMEFTPKQANMDFDPSIKNLIAPHRSKEQEESMKLHRLKIDAIKNDPSVRRKGTDEAESGGPLKLTIGTTFYGDIDGACPNDNTIAVSKAGRIISMMNSHVGIYNTSGAKLNFYTLTEFFRGSTNSSPCDPKVEYDPVADRFFMFIQDCGSDNTKNNIAFGFSKTNDPNGSWNIYKFATDPFGDGSWSDYPKVAINQDEVFVSINLFGKNGGSYRQAILYQLDKTDGYAGRTMDYKIWTGFKNGTILPIRSGANGHYGPGIYAVQAVAGGGSYINYYDITGKLSDANSRLIHQQLNTDAYQPGSPAYQYNTSYRLDVGDCRMQDGYYQNGVIHFVFTAEDGSGYSGIRYHRIDPVKLDINNYQFFSSADERDFAYPAISPFSNIPTDRSSVIHFASSGKDFYPDMRAKLYHHDFSSDNSIRVKVGPGPNKDCDNGDYVRWGDYSGIARHYGLSAPTVWIAGSVGNDIKYSWWTYIAEIKAVATATHDPLTSHEVVLSPNPAFDKVKVEFELKQATPLIFAIYNSTGQLVSRIFESDVAQGNNVFSFSTGQLVAGNYFLKILNNQNEILKTEPFVVVGH